MTDSQERTHVGPQSWVPAGLAVVAVIGSFGLGMRVVSGVGSLEKAIDTAKQSAREDNAALRLDFERVREDVRLLIRATNDTVTRESLRLWMLRLELENAGLGLKVPTLETRQ